MGIGMVLLRYDCLNCQSGIFFNIVNSITWLYLSY